MNFGLSDNSVICPIHTIDKCLYNKEGIGLTNCFAPIATSGLLLLFSIRPFLIFYSLNTKKMYEPHIFA
uniref:Putative ovule protein n=1 Tax=Solanum chacoense TaxID=4108 RepID=A0A0V0IGJ2_SOLCH